MHHEEDDKTPDRGSIHRRDLKPLASLVAVGLAVWAQQLVTRSGYEQQGMILYALAILLFLWGASPWSERELRLAVPEEPVQRVGRSRGSAGLPYVRVGLGLLSVALALLAYRGFGGNRFSNAGLLAWLGALASYWIAAVGFGPLSGFVHALRCWALRLLEVVQQADLSFRLSGTAVLLVGITVIGVFFRVYRLPGVPAEMTADHGEKLLDVYDVLNGTRRIFFPRNTGREALQFYLTAAMIRFTPLTISHLALKAGTVLVSIVAVPLTYFLGRCVYGRGVGLLASCFIALSRWHIAISRVGLRFPFTPTFVALTLPFLFRAFRRNRSGDWVACGIALGAGLHGYTSMRFVPLLLVVLVVAKTVFDLIRWLRRWLDLRTFPQSWGEHTALSPDFWGRAFLGAGVSLLVFLPLVRYWCDRPDMFWFRAMTRVSDLERPLPGSPWRLLWGNVTDALLMFNYRGGPVWVNTVPGDPVLNTVVGGLFVLGVAFALWRLASRGDRRGAYLLLCLFVLLLPSASSLAFPEENPSVVRAGGAIPAVALFAALPVYVVAKALHRALRPRRWWLTVVVVGALFVSAGGLTFDWYFREYDRRYRRKAWNTTELGEVARGFADSVGDLEHVFHVVYPRWVHTPNIGINAGDVTWQNALLDLDDLQAHAADPEPKLYLLHINDRESLDALRARLPQGRMRRYQSAVPGKDFLIYFVPACDRGLRQGPVCGRRGSEPGHRRWSVLCDPGQDPRGMTEIRRSMGREYRTWREQVI